MRERIVIGNWKMNPPTVADAVELARNVAERMPGGVYVGVAPAAVQSNGDPARATYPAPATGSTSTGMCIATPPPESGSHPRLYRPPAGP